MCEIQQANPLTNSQNTNVATHSTSMGRYILTNGRINTNKDIKNNYKRFVFFFPYHSKLWLLLPVCVLNGLWLTVYRLGRWWQELERRARILCACACVCANIQNAYNNGIKANIIVLLWLTITATRNGCVQIFYPCKFRHPE